jgi:hypothetical protein
MRAQLWLKIEQQKSAARLHKAPAISRNGYAVGVITRFAQTMAVSGARLNNRRPGHCDVPEIRRSNCRLQWLPPAQPKRARGFATLISLAYFFARQNSDDRNPLGAFAGVDSIDHGLRRLLWRMRGDTGTSARRHTPLESNLCHGSERRRPRRGIGCTRALRQGPNPIRVPGAPSSRGGRYPITFALVF